MPKSPLAQPLSKISVVIILVCVVDGFRFTTSHSFHLVFPTCSTWLCSTWLCSTWLYPHLFNLVVFNLVVFPTCSTWLCSTCSTWLCSTCSTWLCSTWLCSPLVQLGCVQLVQLGCVPHLFNLVVFPTCSTWCVPSVILLLLLSFI